MAKSNLGSPKPGQVGAGGRVTANGKVTRAGALAKDERRGVLNNPRQYNLRRTIRHPRGIVDPEEYHEIRGIIEESKLRYKIDWADSLRAGYTGRLGSSNPTLKGLRFEIGKAESPRRKYMSIVGILCGHYNHQPRQTCQITTHQAAPISCIRMPDPRQV
jgi:hypothetical protein